MQQTILQEQIPIVKERCWGLEQMAFWRKKPLLKNYVSEIDEFLQAFDEKAEANSASRKAEESKYQRLNQLRDDPDAI